jgi:hypothetical protein
VLMPPLPESQPVVTYSIIGQVEETEWTEQTATLELQIQPISEEEDPANSAFTKFLSQIDNSAI